MQGHPVRASRWPGKERVWQDKVDYSLQQLDLFTGCWNKPTESSPNYSYGKMFLEFSVPSPTANMEKVTVISEGLFKKSQRPTFQCLKVDDGQKADWYEAQSVMLRGGAWTLNIGESPKEGTECSLSQILDKGGRCPEVLFIEPSLPRDSEPSGEAGQTSTGSSESGTDETSYAVRMRYGRIGEGGGRASRPNESERNPLNLK